MPHARISVQGGAHMHKTKGERKKVGKNSMRAPSDACGGREETRANEGKSGLRGGRVGGVAKRIRVSGAVCPFVPAGPSQSGHRALIRPARGKRALKIGP